MTKSKTRSKTIKAYWKGKSKADRALHMKPAQEAAAKFKQEAFADLRQKLLLKGKQ